MKLDRIESNTRHSGGRTAARTSETAAAGPGSNGPRENLLDALRECYGIANGEARDDRPSGPESNPVAALLRRPIR